MSDGITGHITGYKAKPPKIDADGMEVETAKLVVTIEVELTNNATEVCNAAMVTGSGIKANPMQLTLAVGS